MATGRQQDLYVERDQTCQTRKPNSFDGLGENTSNRSSLSVLHQASQCDMKRKKLVLPVMQGQNESPQRKLWNCKSDIAKLHIVPTQLLQPRPRAQLIAVLRGHPQHWWHSSISAQLFASAKEAHCVRQMFPYALLVST